MATVEEVKKLAALARITIRDDELEKFTKEFDAIIAYVGQLAQLNLESAGSGSVSDGKPELRNVMREDGTPHPPGAYTDTLIAQFPASAEATAGKPEDGAYLAVKQIITHD